MIILNMGGAIEHWLGFQDKIGRSFMMNEDALKYPLSDYLVNDGSINIKSIDLEYPHPNFSNRLVDLAISDAANKQLNNLFELKLAKSTTRHQSEKQRIFNDLIRLHLANKVASDKCYFIITGKSVNFQRDFRDFPNVAPGFYRKWFSFVKGQSLTFNVATERAPDYQLIYNTFINEYSGSFQDGGANVLTLPSQITTTCEFITAFKMQLVPYMTGIWSVS
ncbi:MAG TPA: hypothetical protein VKG26_16655 [Bacteroidia bacterium]|nr:hypothetical protein [Bacteroidia bacterium]